MSVEDAVTTIEHELNVANLLFRFDQDPNGSGVCWSCVGDSGLYFFIDPSGSGSAWYWKATHGCVHASGVTATRELAVIAALEALASNGGDVTRLPGWIPLAALEDD